jgi:hypothetical protein
MILTEAGGSIKKNKEALLPQVHDSKSMLKATKPDMDGKSKKP